jgi:acyl dehydratase
MTEMIMDKGSRSLRFGPRRIEKDDLLAFAAVFDPQPVHLDEHAARATPLHGLAASGWHTCALIARALEEALAGEDGYLGMTGVDELRWLRPVRPDDELCGEVKWGAFTQCLCQPALQRRPAWVEARNELGEIVLRWSCHMLFGRSAQKQKGVVHTVAPSCEMRRARSARAAPRLGDHFIKYFEDVVRGDAIVLGSHLFDCSDVATFEGILTGARTRVDRRIARRKMQVSGWHVGAAWMRLIVEYYERRAKELAAAGGPVPILGPATGLRWVRWPAPVSIGDRITFTGWVEHKVNAASHGRWGLLVAGGEGRNERGEVVVSFYPQFLLERRPVDRLSPPCEGSVGLGSGR